MVKISTFRETRDIARQKKEIAKQEKAILNEKENKYLKNKLGPLKRKLQDKIPESMIETFEKAFEKGFYLVFQKGTPVINKSYSARNIRKGFNDNKKELNFKLRSKNFRRLDNSAEKGIIINKSLSAVEGTGLGLLGLGLPDIPLFLGMILKTIYEICLNYGFEYESDMERVYILNLICMASSKGEERAKYSNKADIIGDALDWESLKEWAGSLEKSDILFEVNSENSSLQSITKDDLDKMIKETSEKLSKTIVGAKLIQGITLLGVVGGVLNYKIISDISKIAKLKYKKRFIKILLFKREHCED